MSFTKTTLVAAMLIAGSSAMAQSKGAATTDYFNIGYTSLSYQDNSVSTTFKPTGLNLVYGSNVWENIGLEGLLNAGMASDQQTISGTAYTKKVTSILGLYVKPYVQFGDTEVYGRLGYASIRTDLSSGTASDSGSGSSTSYGLGAKYNVAKNIGISGDYMSFYNKEGITITGFTLGVAYGF